MDYAIKLTGVKKTRKGTESKKGFVMDIPELAVNKGCMTGIIGKNGAGKTTLIKAVTGIMSVDEGEIEVMGMKYPDDEIAIKDNIGLVINNGIFYHEMTLKNMEKIYSVFYSKWDKMVFSHYINRFGLDIHQKIKELSTGMRAKFAIAAALSHHAEVIILDEPSSGLDPMARAELIKILSEVMDREEATVVISTHITSDLDRFADYIVMMDEGRILFSEEKDELIDGHRLVKGGLDNLNAAAPYLVGYTKNAFGFEGLTKNMAGLAGVGGLSFEKPNTEQIMEYYIKKNEGDDLNA